MSRAQGPGPARRLSLSAIAVNPSGATLLAIGFVDSIGTALYLAGGALFFIHVVGLSTTQVGIGLSVAGLVGFAAQAPIGWLADQIGPRRMLIILNIWRAAGFIAYVFVRNFPEVLLVASLLGIGEQSVHPVYQALVERVVGPDRRLELMARIRVTYNVGYTFGGALAAIALGIGTHLAFASMFLGNALTFIVAAIALPRVKMIAAPGAPGADAAGRARRGIGRMRLTAVRDGRYLYVAALNSVLTLHMSILSIAIPLWVVLHTHAPRAVVGPLLIVNTALAVAFQVRATRGTDTVVGGAAALRRASLALAACCLLFTVTPGLARGWAIAVLVAAVAAMTIGEVYQSAGGWALSYQLAPERGRAEYLATFSLGVSAQYIAGPTIVTLGVVDHGIAGWLVLAAAFLLAGALARPAAVAAARRLPSRDPVGAVIEMTGGTSLDAS